MQVRLRKGRSLAPFPLLLPVLSRRAGAFAAFRVRGWARMALKRAEVKLPPSGPFHALGLHTGYALHMDRLDVRAPALRLLET